LIVIELLTLRNLDCPKTLFLILFVGGGRFFPELTFEKLIGGEDGVDTR
jgi:hypothetical protein